MMATLTYDSTPEEDRAVAWAKDRFNQQTGQNLTALEFVRGRVQHMLRQVIEAFNEHAQVDRGSLYRAATMEDQAAIDAILDKYRS